MLDGPCSNVLACLMLYNLDDLKLPNILGERCRVKASNDMEAQGCLLMFLRLRKSFALPQSRACKHDFKSACNCTEDALHQYLNRKSGSWLSCAELAKDPVRRLRPESHITSST